MYCPKCVKDVEPYDVDYKEILDENRECAMCMMPKVCPNCCTEQNDRYARFPSIVCMDCIHEADDYLRRVGEVSESVNYILRLREEMGYEPDELLWDATMLDRDMRPMKLKPGMKIEIEPVPMCFAVAVVSRKGEEASVDFVPLCPSALKRLLAKILGETASSLGMRFTIPVVN